MRIARLRYFLLVAVLAFAEAPAGAQPPANILRIGVLGDDFLSRPVLGLRRGLRELGYIEGQNIILETRRSSEPGSGLYPLAVDLVRLRVNVIVAHFPGALQVAMKATKTIPIVMTYPSDAVAGGIVASLERPGANVTGVTGLASGLAGKWLELVKEAVPEVKRVAVLWSAGTGNEVPEWKDIETTAHALRVELQSLEVHERGDLTGAFKSATTGRADAFVVLPHIFGNSREIAELAIKNRLPGIFWRRDFAAAGGLMAYGANPYEQSRRAAYFVDKILKGAKPAELPVEVSKNFELVINLKSAKELGLSIPPRVLAWADDVFR